MIKRFRIEDVKKIVILRTDRIGEVLLSTPVIEALKEHFTQAQITFVTSTYARDILSFRDDLEEVLTFDTIGRKGSLTETVIFSGVLRQKGFDMAIVLNPHKFLHLGVFLAGIRYRVGFDRKWGFLLTHKIKDTKDEGRQHEVQYNLELLKAIGIDEKYISPILTVAEGDNTLIREIIRQAGIDSGKKTIVVHPGSSNPAKCWPLENFVELIKRITADTDANIILSGDKAEAATCDEIKHAIGNRVFSFAGAFTLRQLMALLGEVDLLITNDNGPMHIAACLGTSVIAIFGRNIKGVSPKRWGPCGEGHVIFYKDPGCSPCLDRDCTYNFKCLRSITPEEVFHVTKEALQ